MSVGDCRSCPAFAPRDSGLPKIGPLAGVITVERCAPMRFWCLFSAATSDELVWKELVSPDSAKFLQWGTLKLFVYGYFDYTDIFSRRHRWLRLRRWIYAVAMHYCWPSRLLETKTLG